MIARWLIILAIVGQQDSDLARYAKRANQHTTSKLCPMTMVNYPNRQASPLSSRTDLDRVANGLRTWSRVTDTAIIGTRPGCSWVYPELRRRVPGMTIIPGIRTASLLDPFDSVEGWRLLAEEVRRVLEASGQTTILLEHETALRSVTLGYEVVDGERLARGLALLPGDTTYIWRPSLFWFIAGDAGRDRLADVCRVAEEVLFDVVFVSQSHNAPGNVGTPQFVEAEALLVSIAERPPLQKTYFYGSDRHYWQYDQLHDVLRLLRDREWVMIYPRLDRWELAAKRLAGQLNERIR